MIKIFDYNNGFVVEKYIAPNYNYATRHKVFRPYHQLVCEKNHDVWIFKTMREAIQMAKTLEPSLKLKKYYRNGALSYEEM